MARIPLRKNNLTELIIVLRAIGAKHKYFGGVDAQVLPQRGPPAKTSSPVLCG